MPTLNFFFITYFLTMEFQNSWCWKAYLEMVSLKPPVQAWSAREGFPGLYQVRFIMSPRMNTPQPLLSWATCFSACFIQTISLQLPAIKGTRKYSQVLERSHPLALIHALLWAFVSGQSWELPGLDITHLIEFESVFTLWVVQPLLQGIQVEKEEVGLWLIHIKSRHSPGRWI